MYKRGLVKGMISQNTILYDYELSQNENQPILILTPEGEILHLNEAATELFGNYYWEGQYLDLDEPSYKKWLHFISNLKSTNTPLIENFNIGMQNGVYHNVTIKGGYQEAQHLIHVQIVSSEKVDFVVKEGLCYSNLEMSHRHLMHYVSKGIIITDSNGRIVEVNNCALIMLKRKRYELMYEHYEVLFENMDVQETRLQQYINKVRLTGHASRTVIYQSTPPKKSHLRFDCMQEKNGRYFVMTISDVTEKKILQEKLEQQDSLNVIGQMAASIAHEIRNPMTSLMGFTELLKLQATDEAVGYLSVIESELQRMEQILSELLHLSKPRARKVDYVDLEKMLQDVMSVMLPHASMYGSVFQLAKYTSHPLIIKGCEVSLKQVFINLLKNALEAMPNGGIIELDLKIGSEGWAEIYVKDEGEGIPEEHKQTMFQPFQTTKVNGTGLGLAYVKKIMDECEGCIEVESEIGEGTTFKLSFPMVSRCEITAL